MPCRRRRFIRKLWLSASGCKGRVRAVSCYGLRAHIHAPKLLCNCMVDGASDIDWGLVSIDRHEIVVDDLTAISKLFGLCRFKGVPLFFISEERRVGNERVNTC